MQILQPQKITLELRLELLAYPGLSDTVLALGTGMEIAGVVASMCMYCVESCYRLNSSWRVYAACW